MALEHSSIKFLQGTQAKLDTLITNGGAAEGSFYLTNDTHRLYIGKNVNGKHIPVPVNQGVVSVKTTDELVAKTKTAGEFYYITGTTEEPVNILCVYNGQDLIQINADTFIDTYVSKNDTGLSTGEAFLGSDGEIYDTKEAATAAGATVAGNAIKITFDLKQTTNNNKGDAVTDSDHFDSSYASTISSSIYLTKEDFDAIIGTSVDVKADCLNGVLTIKNEGVGASEATDSGFKLSTIGSGIRIAQALNADDEPVDDEFTIEGTTYRVTEVGADSDGKISVKLTGTGVDAIQNIGFTSDADLYYKLDDNEDDTLKTRIYNQGTLPIYDIIAKELKGVNAMTYKGTIGISSEEDDPQATYENLPSTSVEIGDTYMVAYDGTFAGTSALSGDLFIATGTEGTNGYITGPITWTYVPAGNVDTTYSMEIIAGTESAPPAIKISDSSPNSNDTYLYFNANKEDGNDSLVLEVVTKDGKKSLVYSHKDYEITGIDTDTGKVTALNDNGGVSSGSPLEAEQKFTVISGAKIENGHITEFVTTDHYLPKDSYTKYTYTSSIANSTNDADKIGDTGYVKKAALTTTLKGEGTDGTTDTYNLSIESETLAIKSSTSERSLTCEVDILWGSF